VYHVDRRGQEVNRGSARREKGIFRRWGDKKHRIQETYKGGRVGGEMGGGRKRGSVSVENEAKVRGPKVSGGLTSDWDLF